MSADTAMSVASEMVEDLSLSAEDAKAIAAAIKAEITQLTGQAPLPDMRQVLCWHLQLCYVVLGVPRHPLRRAGTSARQSLN